MLKKDHSVTTFIYNFTKLAASIFIAHILRINSTVHNSKFTCRVNSQLDSYTVTVHKPNKQQKNLWINCANWSYCGKYISNYCQKLLNEMVVIPKKFHFMWWDSHVLYIPNYYILCVTNDASYTISIFHWRIATAQPIISTLENRLHILTKHQRFKRHIKFTIQQRRYAQFIPYHIENTLTNYVAGQLISENVILIITAWPLETDKIKPKF